jgi:hypothetical protein
MLGNDAVEKWALRKESQRVKALERLAVHSGYTACLSGGGDRSLNSPRKNESTNKVIYDDPSTHDCVCCEDLDTDCEPEYPCKAVINHCTTCSNPWDITCESDSSDGHDDDMNVDTLSHCLPCESVGRQRYMREYECEDTTCSDQTIKDIHDAIDSNLDKIEPRSAGNIQHYSQATIGQYNARHAPINGSITVEDDNGEVCAVNEEQRTFPDDDDSQTIETFLKAISMDINLDSRKSMMCHNSGPELWHLAAGVEREQTASGHQPDIPSWLCPITTMDAGSRDVPDIMQIAQSATPRMTQSQEGGLNDERESMMCHNSGPELWHSAIACAMETGNKQSDGRDVASDEVQDSEEFYDCIEDHYTDEDNLMQRVGTWVYDRNTDSRANDYIYYYHRSGSRANNDGPPSDFHARNDVLPNNNCLNHESGNDRRTYIEILSPIPMSQSDNACACVAISHRSHVGASPAVQTTDTDSHDYDVNADKAPEEEYDNYNHNYNYSDNEELPTGDRSGCEGTAHDPGHALAHDATTTTNNQHRRLSGDSFDASRTTLVSRRITINLFEALRGATTPVLIRLGELITCAHTVGNSI